MIENQVLSKMSKKELDQEFYRELESLENLYRSKPSVYSFAGINPEQAINDLFDELKVSGQ